MMTSSPSPAPDADQKPCPRCKINLSITKARGESMCIDCFTKYIGTKIAKRLDGFKVRTGVAPRKVLLALSLGVSSLTLLHHVTKMLRTQVDKIGRCGFELQICIMNDTSVFARDESREQEDRERVRRISELYFDDREKWFMVKRIIHKSTEECFNSISTSDQDFRDLVRSCQAQIGADLSTSHSIRNYENYLASLPSASARSDVNAVITRRFIIREAQQAGCDALLWGDTTTRLAERTLSDAAKGRGFSLPWQTSDGPTPYGLEFSYPMRELLRKEIVTFTGLANPSYASLVKSDTSFGTSQVSSKDATIDALMVQYFESVEENFPSIVTNVVRTSNRLNAADSDVSTTRRCQLCALPVAEGTDGLHGWAGSQEDDAPTNQDAFYCYGCARSMKSKKS